jgi:hypothetical protein
MSSREPCATREVMLDLGLQGAPGTDVTAAVFVFDGGILVSHAILRCGEASVRLPDVMSARVRIFVGPAPRPGQAAPTLDTLERLRPYEPAFNLRKRLDRYTAAPVPDLYWRYWQWCRCRVHGLVTCTTDGVDRPLQGARVHIRKIEPFFAFLGGLSDADVLRLRDDFVAAPAAPVPPAIAALRSQSPAPVRRALAENVTYLRAHWRRSPRWWFDRCSEIAAPVTDREGRFALEYWNLCEDDSDLDFRVEYPAGEGGPARSGLACPGLTVWDYVCGAEISLRLDAERGQIGRAGSK